jgi:hypothetical protein
MSIPVTHRAPAVPKRVILFGFLLGLSLALLGLVGSHLVGSLNKNYVGIVTRQLPSLGLIRAISQAQSVSRRLIEAAPLHMEDPEINAMQAIILRVRQENGDRLDKLERLLDDPEARKLLGRLREERLSYHLGSDQFLALLKTRPERPVWESQRIAMVDVDQRYVQAQDRLAEYCEASAASRSDELTQRSRDLTRFFFIVAAWPLVLAVGFFIYGLISTLALFYRSRANT